MEELQQTVRVCVLHTETREKTGYRIYLVKPLKFPFPAYPFFFPSMSRLFMRSLSEESWTRVASKHGNLHEILGGNEALFGKAVCTVGFHGVRSNRNVNEYLSGAGQSFDIRCKLTNFGYVVVFNEPYWPSNQFTGHGRLRWCEEIKRSKALTLLYGRFQK